MIYDYQVRYWEMKMMEISLIELCARICFYAQQHSMNEDTRSSHTLDLMMEHTSFVVSCFIAQNTEFGSEGVEWEIVHKELAGPVLSYDKWLKVIREKVLHFEDLPRTSSHFYVGELIVSRKFEQGSINS